MIRSRPFWRDERGASAAEFGLVLPLLLLLLFGTIDVGRYAWALGQAEKATQTGARWAVATDMVASGLYDYSFAVTGGLPQGSTVSETAFPGLVCTSDGALASCACKPGGTCSFPTTANNAAFNAIVNRMGQIYPGVQAENVVVTYSWSGLGFAGDPNGADVSPLTTVSLREMEFEPMTTFIFGADVSLPSFSYTLTMEDGSGTTSN